MPCDVWIKSCFGGCRSLHHHNLSLVPLLTFGGWWLLHYHDSSFSHCSQIHRQQTQKISSLCFCWTWLLFESIPTKIRRSGVTDVIFMSKKSVSTPSPLLQLWVVTCYVQRPSLNTHVGKKLSYFLCPESIIRKVWLDPLIFITSKHGFNMEDSFLFFLRVCTDAI